MPAATSPSVYDPPSPTASRAPDDDALRALLSRFNASTTDENTDDADQPNWRCPESKRMAPTWTKCRDAYDGTDALLNTRYIPKHPKEGLADYRARLAHSAVFNAFGATISGLVGLAFAKTPKLGDDVPSKITSWAENFDGAGTTIGNFARGRLEDGLLVGSCGLMVLYPPRPEGANASDENDGLLRPYARPIDIEDVYSWDTEVVGAREYLTQLVIHEGVKRRKGRFGREIVNTYREFRHDVTGPLGVKEPVTYIIWEEREDAKKRVVFVPTAAGFIVNGKGESLSRIPYEGLLLGRALNRMIARPALKDLLDLMLKAFRIDSDRCYLMHQACVPIPVRKGYRKDLSTEGAESSRRGRGSAAASNVIMDLPGDTPQFSGASFTWAEIQGTAFQPTKDELEKIKAEMGAVGISFLAPSTRAAETADARRLDNRIDNATLSGWLSLLESMMEGALMLMAEYGNLEMVKNGEQTSGSFTVNRDFETTIMGADMIKAYSDLVLADQLTLETFLDILQSGRALPEGFNATREVSQLKLLATQRSEEAAQRFADLQRMQQAGKGAPPTGQQTTGQPTDGTGDAEDETVDTAKAA